MEIADIGEGRAGPKDLRVYADLVGLLREVLHASPETIHERLYHEACCAGWNVATAAAAFGINPHVYDDRMQAFYSATDAFAIELAVSHSTPACWRVDAAVHDALLTAGLATGADVLVLGDGIGSDSLRLAVLGYSPTYFEFDGVSSRLAKARFERAGVANKIRCIHELSRLPVDSFDAVICREVLEHVPDPVSVINNIWQYLRAGGYAVITESFGLIDPWFPTHLKSNLRYAGMTERMFAESGFRFVRAYQGRRPMVFQRAAKGDTSLLRHVPRGTHRSLLRRLAEKVIQRL